MFGNDPRCRRLCLARRRRAPMNKSSLMNAKVALRLWLHFGVLVECFGFERIYFEFHLSNLCSNTFTFFAVYFFEDAARKCAAGHWRAHSTGVCLSWRDACAAARFLLTDVLFKDVRFMSFTEDTFNGLACVCPTHRTFTTFILKNKTY